MAATTREDLLIKVIVDDKEALAQIGNINKLLAQTAAAGKLPAVKPSGKSPMAEAKKDAEDAEAAQKKFNAQVSSGISLGKAFAAAWAAKQVVENIERITNSIVKFEGVSGFFAQTGVDIDAAREASGGLVSDMELMTRANQFLSSGVKITSDQFATLARQATVMAQRVGFDAKQALESVTVGILKNSPLMLDNVALYVDGRKAYEDHAKSLGKSRDELTRTEETMATFNAVMDQLNTKVGGSSVTVDGVSGKFIALMNSISASVLETAAIIDKSTILNSVFGNLDNATAALSLNFAYLANKYRDVTLESLESSGALGRLTKSVRENTEASVSNVAQNILMADSFANASDEVAELDRIINKLNRAQLSAVKDSDRVRSVQQDLNEDIARNAYEMTQLAKSNGIASASSAEFEKRSASLREEVRSGSEAISDWVDVEAMKYIQSITDMNVKDYDHAKAVNAVREALMANNEEFSVEVELIEKLVTAGRMEALVKNEKDLAEAYKKSTEALNQSIEAEKKKDKGPGPKKSGGPDKPEDNSDKIRRMEQEIVLLGIKDDLTREIQSLEFELSNQMLENSKLKNSTDMARLNILATEIALQKQSLAIGRDGEALAEKEAARSLEIQLAQQGRKLESKNAIAQAREEALRTSDLSAGLKEYNKTLEENASVAGMSAKERETASAQLAQEVAKTHAQNEATSGMVNLMGGITENLIEQKRISLKMVQDLLHAELKAIAKRNAIMAMEETAKGIAASIFFGAGAVHFQAAAAHAAVAAAAGAGALAVGTSGGGGSKQPSSTAASRQSTASDKGDTISRTFVVNVFTNSVYTDQKELGRMIHQASDAAYSSGSRARGMASNSFANSSNMGL